MFFFFFSKGYGDTSQNLKNDPGYRNMVKKTCLLSICDTSCGQGLSSLDSQTVTTRKKKKNLKGFCKLAIEGKDA
jgi:hypothetical protein